MNATHLQLHPVDILASSAALATPEELFEVSDERYSAYRDLGGQPVPTVSVDERAVYVPFAESLRGEGRKHEIEHGLGNLGLIVMTTKVLAQAPDHKYSYATEILKYTDSLAGRRNLLKTPGSIDGLGAYYGTTDEAWANKYADQLDELQVVIQSTRLYRSLYNLHATMQKVPASKRPALAPNGVEVQLDTQNQPVIVPLSARKKRSRRAA